MNKAVALAVCPAAINKRNETATLFKEVTQGGMRNFYVFACCVAVIFALLYLGIHFGLASSEGDPDPALDPYVDQERSKQELPKSAGSVFGFIQYPHDLDKANLFYMLLQASPESKVPGVSGNYSTTDVNVFVKLRGVDVGRSLHHSRHRKRPHVYQNRERKRWAEMMHDLWSLISITRTLESTICGISAQNWTEIYTKMGSSKQI